MAEFLKKEDFKPGLRSKITQVNSAMQKLEDEIETVYLAGELDTTKKDEIKKRIAAFDKVLIGSDVIKQFMKDDPKNVEEIKKIADAISERIDQMIKDMEEDLDIKSKAGFGANIQELKDKKQTETGKVVDKIVDYTKKPDDFDVDKMLKAAQQELYIDDIKIERYDQLVDKQKMSGYTVANDEKAFNRAFSGGAHGSLHDMSSSLDEIKSGADAFKTNHEAVIEGIRLKNIKKADCDEVKKVEEFLRHVSNMPSLDPAYKAKVTAALTAIQDAKADSSKLSGIESALSGIDPEKVKDDVDIDKNQEELKRLMKFQLEKGFLSYMPDKAKEYIKQIDEGKPLTEVAKELAVLYKQGTYKATLAALKEMETEISGIDKDTYLNGIRAKKAAAFDRVATLKEMKEVSVPTRPAEKPKFDLSSIGLVAETEAGKPGLNTTQFEYTKKDGDDYVDIDARDEDLQEADVDKMVDNLWEKMSDKQKSSMHAYTETHLSVPPRGFAYGIRAFFAHLTGRLTYRESEIDRLTKESMKKQISDQGRDTRTASIREEATNAPLRAQKEKADKMVDEYAKDYDRSLIGQVIDKGAGIDMKKAKEEANNEAMKQAQTRRASRDIDDEGR